ncbi:MAG TPA: hypothetical protein VK066_30640 [Chloroflexota bacterium]|nr:hypothetical protein [Chloroflexota bacterium]
MATPLPAGPIWPQLVEQLCSALAASNATLECAFDNLEVVVLLDGAADGPPTRWLLNGTVRLRASAER